MKSNFDESKELCNEIIKQVIPNFKFKGDIKQLHTQMHPIASNIMFKRENDLLESERFKVLITLARILDDENLNKAIVALKYQLTVKK